MSSFSERQGFAQQVPIEHRADLPLELRVPLLKILRGFGDDGLRIDRAEKVLNPYGIRTMPRFTGNIVVEKDEDSREATTYKRIFLGCEWHQVYDLIEDLFEQIYFYEDAFASAPEDFRSGTFRKELNAFFRAAGIGWQVEKGKVISREEESLEKAVSDADTSLKVVGRETSRKHLAAARAALSHRPEPNTAGAITHALGALEGVARDATGGEGMTLGDILKRCPGLIPQPLDKALGIVWGYASNVARHVTEGREAQREEAELVVGLSAALISYINQKRT